MAKWSISGRFRALRSVYLPFPAAQFQHDRRRTRPKIAANQSSGPRGRGGGSIPCASPTRPHTRARSGRGSGRRIRIRSPSVVLEDGPAIDGEGLAVGVGEVAVATRSRLKLPEPFLRLLLMSPLFLLDLLSHCLEESFCLPSRLPPAPWSPRSRRGELHPRGFLAALLNASATLSLHLEAAGSDDLGHARRDQRHEDHRDEPVADTDAEPPRSLDGIGSTARHRFLWFASYDGPPHPIGARCFALILAVAGPVCNRR